ncbi:MAG: hypothetical protein C0412_19290 [Flavobacterium sp.]|nr:hypothetical protein [Flavobacterium sp.]
MKNMSWKHLTSLIKTRRTIIKSLLNKMISLFFRTFLKKKYNYHVVPDVYGVNSYKMRDIRDDADFFGIAEPVVKSRRTVLYYDRLFNLFQSLKNVIANSDKSETINILEIGAFHGGGSYFLAAVSQIFAPQRVNMFSIDTFEGHSAKDFSSDVRDGSHKPGRFGNAKFEDVKTYLSQFPFVQVIKGRIQDCADMFSDKKFHFIHLDVDIYHPTVFSLSFFGEKMVPGGIIIVDDYGFVDNCPGVKKAVDEYCMNKRIIKISLESGQCLLIFSR